MDPSYNFHFTDNCAYSEANPKVFVEKNFSGSILLDNKEIRFPENIYSASNDTYIFKYEDTVFLSQEEAIVHYSLNEIESYKDGISLYSATYTKSPSNQTEHEIRTPLNNTIPAYNKTPLVLPITDFNQSPFEVNYSSYQSIYNSLKNNLELIIDTSYDNGSSVTYSSFPFSSSNFTQYAIETLPGKYKVTFKFQDSNPSVTPSGWLVIEVNKTPVVTGNMIHVADLNINTLSCCKDNPTLQSFLSESSSHSSSSNSSSSSSSNSSSSSSSSSLSSNSSNSSSSSYDSWPPLNDLWVHVATTPPNPTVGQITLYCQPHNSMASHNNYIYSVGFVGVDPNLNLGLNQRGCITKYDPSDNSFSVASLLPDRLQAGPPTCNGLTDGDSSTWCDCVPFSIYSGGKIYVGSYYNSRYVYITTTHGYITDFWSYDIDNNLWVRLPDRPLGSVKGFRLGRLPNGNLIMNCGYYEWPCWDTQCYSYIRNTFVMNIDTGVWTEFPSYPGYLGNHGGGLVGDTYCQSGNAYYTSGTNFGVYEIWKFTNYGTWEYEPSDPSTIPYKASCLVDFHGQIYGGCYFNTQTDSNNSWKVYDKNTKIWYPRQKFNFFPTAREGTAHGRYIYVTTGNAIYRYG